MNNKQRFTSNEFIGSLCNEDYLVIPLSVLLSMPLEWRQKHTKHLLQIKEKLEIETFVIGPYTVGVRNKAGKFTFDYLAKSDMLLPDKVNKSWFKRLFS